MSEARQRWRLIFARDEDARYLSHLDAVHQWERALRRADIPVATSAGFSPRPKLIFAAPLQLGMLAEHDLADLYTDERLTAPDLRTRLIDGLPRGYRLVGMHDVWLGADAIAPQLSAADYRMTLFNVEQSAVDTAIATILAADKLPRTRKREAKAVTYDLRPLILEVRAGEPDPTATAPALPAVARPVAGLWMRLRHSQDRGSGRPDEVVAALADEMGFDTYSLGSDDAADAPESEPVAASTEAREGRRPVLEVIRPVRERLWLADELA